jgi:site-specific DNA-cytosine methylase
VAHRVINSSLLLPQHRQRIYFAGFRKDLSAEWGLFRWPRLPVLHRTLNEILQPDDHPAVAQCSLT